MTDFNGLQIDIRCIKCGRLPTANVALFEMQNHLYICTICGQEAEKAGKQIRWISQPVSSTSISPAPTATAVRTPGSNLPPNSLFAILNLPLNASIEEIEAAIAQRMRLLLREEDSPERTQKIEQLHEWQEKTEDPVALEAYRDSFKNKRPAGQALSVGGRLVYTAEEFLQACEDSHEGWADGERYLRMGQLQHWIIFQIEDRNLAAKIRYYQNRKDISTFRAFNEALYCMVPERPFRFYKQETWEAIGSLSSASTPEELAQKCDLYWQLAEYHLYNGSLAYWLGDARGIAGLKEYYTTVISTFANKGQERGLGLELLLEKALPALPRPHLVVTFDGTEGQYTLDKWDRELPHLPITVKVTNTTRGFTSIDMILEPAHNTLEPQWITLNNSAPVHITGTPGSETVPAVRNLTFMNLSRLDRGKKYRRTLTLLQAGEPGQPQIKQQFPITLRTQSFFAGLRGILWRWGLRGGLVGLAWNFSAGALLAFLLYRIIPIVIPDAYLNNLPDTLSFTACLQLMVDGAVTLLRVPAIPHFPQITFPLIVGAITGLAGFGVGYGKGHMDYGEKRGAKTFRALAFWLSVAFVVMLFVVDQTGIPITQALQYPTTGNILDSFYAGGGSILLGLLILFIAFFLAFIRYQVERSIRTRYKKLLNIPGRA